MVRACGGCCCCCGGDGFCWVRVEVEVVAGDGINCEVGVAMSQCLSPDSCFLVCFLKDLLTSSPAFSYF